MNLKMLLSFFYILFLIDVSLAWKTFFRGRSTGGNLGKPFSEEVTAKDVAEEWFTQKLDHYNPVDERTWQQRYFVNDEFFNKHNGPAFLNIGGEGTAAAEWMTSGAWINYAKKFNALCFQVEHRYYGKSHPTSDLSTENLRYLTSQQALADLANLIVAMNDKYNLTSNNKWIVFGGSYSGALAAWMRAKYSYLVHGAMSASGPLLAKVDFFEYFKVVEESLRTYSDECVTAIKQGTGQVDILLRHMIGQRTLNELFSLCDPIEKSVKNPNDVANLYESLSGNFADVVQYNKDNRIGNSSKSNVTIDTLCDIMVNQTLGTPVHRLSLVNSLMLNLTGEKCLDYKYEKMISEMRKTDWKGIMSEGGRQWTYQTCSEFGFFQTSSYKPQIFGSTFPVSFFIQQCEDIFGPEFNSTFLDLSANRTNMIYGGLNIDVSNVVFVQGSIDPWHALGITRSVNQLAPAIYIKGTAHCANMYPESSNDPLQLRAARKEIAHLIQQWIG